MAKSFRLDPDLERQLVEAAEREGVTISALVRDAVRRRCQETLARSLLDDLEAVGVVGAIAVGGDAAERTGKAFATLLEKRQPVHDPD